MPIKEHESNLIKESNYISRDLSWLKFNFRVLDQVRIQGRSIFDKLKFLAITASNLDEFFMIRVGSLYNYLDYDKQRIDYSGLREKPFRRLLLKESQYFFQEQHRTYTQELKPEFAKNGFDILSIDELTEVEQSKVSEFFMRVVFPMLTPMVYDNYRTFPLLMNKVLTFGVTTQNQSIDEGKEDEKLSFVQIPQNLKNFYEIERDDKVVFVPIEEIIRWKIYKLFRNVEIIDVSLFRVTRNGDITLEESEDMEDDFIDEVKRKLKKRKSGRLVRIEAEKDCSEWMLKIFKRRWGIDDYNIFITDGLLDFTTLFQIAGHKELNNEEIINTPKLPLGLEETDTDLFEFLKQKDLVLHHPYNSVEPLLKFLEDASEDPDVLAIKITIYRLAKNSRITSALQKAAENGKHVSVLFELKARFDEENNIKEAERLQQAGCYVIHGISRYKTHTKLLLIVKKEDEQVKRYVHMSSGNYNEKTNALYTDVSLMTTNEIYAHDVSEFFNAITGHSLPLKYKSLLTAPNNMRSTLIELIKNEAENARKNLNSGIVIKINSLEDKQLIDELYSASQAGVPVKLIVRGICCIRPQRKDLSENIEVRSIVGDFLEHSRIYYFQNVDKPRVFAGSADCMVRSFDRRIESIFEVFSELQKQQVSNILFYNLKDNSNAYTMLEDSTYLKEKPKNDIELFSIHKEFFKFYENKSLENIDLFKKGH